MRCHRHPNPQPGVNMKPTNTPLVVWPCYEPAGQTIALTEEDLVQHVLVIGSTGCGKTTLLRGAMDQLISHESRIGLLILDAKQDGTVEHVIEVAGRAGRERDLVVLGPQGTHILDLFGPLKTLGDVDLVTQRLLLATEPVGRDNPYWQTTTAAMIAAALTLLLVRKRPISFGDAIEFMRSWFVGLESFATLPKPVADVVEQGKREAKKPGSAPQLLGALDHVEVWKHLDPRTRSNLQSCLLNVLRPLLSAAAVRYLDANDRPAFSPALVAEGKLCVVSINALIHPELAAFVLRLARREFFDAVQTRGAGEHPLCGLIADEFPLIVRPEDADQLATLRSKRCFVLAATQGLAAIDDKIGFRLRRAVLLNYNTLVFMRTREEEAGELAAMSLGFQEQHPRRRRPETWEDSAVTIMSHSRSEHPRELICPPGALGRLQPHQGHVVAADGNHTRTPVWFVPWFELAAEEPSPGAHEGYASRYIESLMTRCGLNALLSSELVLATARLDEHLYEPALKQAEDFFRSKACLIPEGLESLPACWLAGLPGILWATRQPDWDRLPYMISRLECENGVLLLSFAQEQVAEDERLTLWDELRVEVNRNLYPSRWRRLKRRHRMLLFFARPDLRSVLESSPGEMF